MIYQNLIYSKSATKLENWAQYGQVYHQAYSPRLKSKVINCVGDFNNRIILAKVLKTVCMETLL